jgi:dephospho-CoA kinase
MTPPKTHQLLGFAGSFASGKDTIAQHLVEKCGYHHVSTGDMVRLMAARERGSVERDVLYEIAKKYREEHGAGFFADLAVREHPFPLLVTGMRSIGEAKAIKQQGGILVFLDAPLKVRYERMVARNRDKETLKTLKQFADFEAKEWYGGDSDSDFNLRGIRDMSDMVIDTTPELERLLPMVFAQLHLEQ